MDCVENYKNIKKTLPENVLLLAVSKTKPEEEIMKLYDFGCRDFGENKVQELSKKYEVLPKDIRWHQIGHLQTNKIKYIIPFVYMIHSIDSIKLAEEVNKQAAKHGRVVNCLLQIKVAEEETKFGFSINEVADLFKNNAFAALKNIKLCGLMAMATNTDDETEILKEFSAVKNLYNSLRVNYQVGEEFKEISMGMSGDYPLAVKEGSTIVRIGSTIFGERDYSQKNGEV
ncbi:MAG: YggS family pyridoxal phosphate-dependent enzyme [Bacteroidales bacterium]|nr:YggS family pyridoxal phosphate-dependent enzyme [Bacteroidales bacterium]